MTEMRQKMEAILKKEMHGLALGFYEDENLTHTKMANALIMDKRSYADIASGEHKCGGLTIVLMLTHLKDANPFLQHLKQQLEAAFFEEGAYV